MREKVKKWVEALFASVTGPTPLEGWEDRYRQHKSGRQVWPSPTEGTPNIIPWPAEWLCISAGGLVTDSEKKRGFRFVPIVCSVSEETVLAGEGVRCLRCGCHLAPKNANMPSSISPPYCSPCEPYIRRALV